MSLDNTASVYEQIFITFVQFGFKMDFRIYVLLCQEFGKPDIHRGSGSNTSAVFFWLPVMV